MKKVPSKLGFYYKKVNQNEIYIITKKLCDPFMCKNSQLNVVLNLNQNEGFKIINLFI